VSHLVWESSVDDYCGQNQIAPYPISERYDVLRDKRSLIPFRGRPGCYVWFTEKGRLIYVGKATDLGARVSSYFIWTAKPDPVPPTHHRWSEQPRYVRTIPVEQHGDEAALEGFLIGALNPVENIRLRT